MHYNKIIQNGNVNDVVNESVVDGVQYIDERPIKGSLNPATSGGVYEAIQGSVIPANVDVIKWSDVLAVDDGDYSEFKARINSDIASGIAPVILDDVNDGAVAILNGTNGAGPLFMTSTDCNERDVMFTNYVITDVAASRTTYTKNMLFKNASNGYASDSDGFVEVKNNRNGVYTYSGNTGANSLDFLADFDNDTAVPSVRFSDVNPPNFAVKIVSTAATDGTVTVYKKANGLYAPLMPSVAGGTTVEAGKTYQLTCVGDCWTLAEFEDPSANYKLVLGTGTNRQAYDAVKIGNRIWMAANLCLTWTGLTIGGDPTAEESNTPWAWYYDNDEITYGNGTTGAKWGLLYNKAAINYLVEHPELLDGWRVPTETDIGWLQTTAGGNTAAGSAAVRKVSAWPNETETATDSTGFSAVPSCHAIWSAEGVTFDAAGTEIAIIHTDGSVDPDTNSSRVMAISDTSPTYLTGTDGHKYNGYSLRLCRDA